MHPTMLVVGHSSVLWGVRQHPGSTRARGDPLQVSTLLNVTDGGYKLLFLELLPSFSHTHEGCLTEP